MWSRAMLLLTLAPVVMGQSVELSRSTIEGYVYGYAADPNGHPLPGVTVYASSIADRQTAITDKFGHYIIFTATPGNYQIKTERFVHAGFTYEDCWGRGRSVTVQAGFRYEVDLGLTTACKYGAPNATGPIPVSGEPNG